jgi:hypothetical protein
MKAGGQTARHSEQATSHVFRKFHALVELERFMTVLTPAVIAPTPKLGRTSSHSLMFLSCRVYLLNLPKCHFTRNFQILYNENQLDALFIFNLFRQSTCTCFGHVYCPSSGGIRCLCTAIRTCYTFRLVTGCWHGQQNVNFPNTVLHVFLISPRLVKCLI